MMNRNERRVRTLRLAASSEAEVRRGSLLLEDALHTASLPQASGGRVLVVRSLDIGNFRASQSSTSLALNIERRIHQLSATAIHAEQALAAGCAVVYFLDDAEPYIALASRLARNGDVSAWFWPLAVKGWQPSMPKDEALRFLLFQVLKTQAGIAAAASMMRAMIADGAIQNLLSALRWQDGMNLLRACGWTKPSLPIRLVELEATIRLDELMPAELFIALVSRVREWGGDDARSIWLAAMSLVIERPARLLDHRVIGLAQRVIKLAMSQDAIRFSLSGASKGAIEAFRSEPRAASPVDGSSVRARLVENSDEASEKFLSPFASTSSDAETEQAIQFEMSESSGESKKAAIFGQTARASSRSIDENDSAIKAPEKARAIERSFGLQWPQSPQPTAHAGFFFLLGVLSRLGMASFLESNARLIELDFPACLLRFFGKRLGISEDDPVMLALFEQGKCEQPPACEFVAPERWRDGLLNPGACVVKSIAEGEGARVLFDSSKRLALAVWRGRPPRDASRFARGLRVKREKPLPFASARGLLFDAWLIAARRWCRRYARAGLLDLARKPGRVCATRTHVDILFDHHEVDIRVRKAGLDFDPGWTPWFGRVVSFHYLYGEQKYAD